VGHLRARRRLLICFTPVGLVAGVLVWQMVADRNDELNIYSNGFTYRDRKGTQQCLWDEIEDFQTTSNGTLTGFKKIDGPWMCSPVRWVVSTS
jgi:hypothetical protein